MLRAVLWRVWLLLVTLTVGLTAAAAWRHVQRVDAAQEAVPAQTATAAPAVAAGPRAPFDFSHHKHADMKLDCTFCHAQALTAAKAGFPQQAQCMACHASVAKDSEKIKQLAALAPEAHLVPIRPVYRLPDFVFFSHAKHAAGHVECAECHGDIGGADVVTAHMPMRMKACVDCHKAKQAVLTCVSCHEAFQQ